MIQAFAFDLDETLTDCEPQHVLATAAMLEAVGVQPEAARAALTNTTGARTRDIVDAIRAHTGLQQSVDELLALRHTAFLAALDDSPAQPLEGALDVLHACRARGPVALVTSGHREDALATVDSLGVRALFQCIVTGDDVEQAKPDPEPYLIAASRMRVPPGDVLVFEDSPRGVASARSAGCRVVAVPNARSTRKEQVRSANLVLPSLANALPLDALLARSELL